MAPKLYRVVVWSGGPRTWDKTTFPEVIAGRPRVAASKAIAPGWGLYQRKELPELKPGQKLIIEVTRIYATKPTPAAQAPAPAQAEGAQA